MTNGIFFAACSFSGRNAREGSSSRALLIDSIHSREKGRTTFASTGVGKWTYCNLRCKVLLTDDLQSSDPHSPAVTRAGMGPGIGNWDVKLNCTLR